MPGRRTAVSPFLVFAGVVCVAFPVLWLCARVGNRQRRTTSRETWEKAWPLIRKRYLAAIDESFERRQAVIAELAQTLELSARAIQARLSLEGIYKPNKH